MEERVELTQKNEGKNAQSAEAEGNTGAAPDYGKFKNAEELLSAYKNLEREFTRRSQELSEIKKSAARSQGVEVTQGEAGTAAAVDKDAVIAEYLKSLNKSTVRLMGSSCGAYVFTPPSKPRTLEEAGKLAGKYFK